MICRRCGKDIVGTNKCLYCGKVLDNFANTGVGGSESEANATNTEFANRQATGGASISTCQDYSSIYGAGGYGDTSQMDYEDNSPEAFYQRYRENSMLEKTKKALGIINIAIPLLGFALVFIAIICSIYVDGDFIPKLFNFDHYNATDQENFEFINKLLMIFLTFVSISIIVSSINAVVDWISMVNFSQDASQNNIDGKMLLTKNRLSDKKGTLEYIFISNSLCMKDDPSQKIAIGIKVIVKALLSIALIIILVNFISYLTLTLMPLCEDPEDLYLMMYTGSEFWLNPNILSVGIIIWANLIINSIINIVVNKKYTRWVKNTKEKGESKNEM